MLTLDGQQLIGDNEYQESSEFINKYFPLDHCMPWLRKNPSQAGLAMLTMPNGDYPYRYVKIGRFFWPTGASRFAFGHFLASSDAVANILPDAYTSDGTYNLLPFKIGNTESNQDPNFSQSGSIVPRESISTMMYLLPPHPLSGIRGLSGQIQSLYLLTIVDQRYFWYFNNVGDIDVPETWTELYDLLFEAVNVTNYTLDTIYSSYLGPSVQMFTLPYEPVPMVLDAVARNVGHRIVVNFDGSVATQLYSTALDALNMDMTNNKNRVVIAGGQPFGQDI